MNTMRQVLAGLALAAACAGAAAMEQPATVPAGGQAGPSGVLLGNFDRGTRPQDDFYR